MADRGRTQRGVDDAPVLETLGALWLRTAPDAGTAVFRGAQLVDANDTWRTWNARAWRPAGMSVRNGHSLVELATRTGEGARGGPFVTMDDPVLRIDLHIHSVDGAMLAIAHRAESSPSPEHALRNHLSAIVLQLQLLRSVVPEGSDSWKRMQTLATLIEECSVAMNTARK